MCICVAWILQKSLQGNASFAQQPVPERCALRPKEGPAGSRPRSTDTNHTGLAANLQAIGYCVNNDDNRREGKAAGRLPKTLWEWWGVRTRLSLTFPWTPHPRRINLSAQGYSGKNNIIQSPLTGYLKYFTYLFFFKWPIRPHFSLSQSDKFSYKKSD